MQGTTIFLGKMKFGDQPELGEARNIVTSAAEHDFNFIDTADVYKKGAAEESETGLFF